MMRLTGTYMGKPFAEVTWSDTGLPTPYHRTCVAPCPACGNPNAMAIGVDTAWIYFCPAQHVVTAIDSHLTIVSL